MMEEETQVIAIPKSSEELSRNEKAIEPLATDSIPDGGLQAWLQVLGAFFLWWNTWGWCSTPPAPAPGQDANRDRFAGLVNGFGAWQSFYTVDLLRQWSPSAIAWIGSTQSFLLLSVGALTGPIYDMGFFRTLLLTGSSLIVVGMFTTSAATEYWQIMLSQGVCTGIGMGVSWTLCAEYREL
jgi:hypothetical protein